MATRKLPLWYMFSLFTIFTTMTESATNAASPPAVDCSTLVLDVADCLSYVMSGSTTSKPEGSCCSGLKSVLKTDAKCLCEAFKNSAQLGVTLNVTKALALPSACHVSAPSVSNCGLNSDTGAAPAPALAPAEVLSPDSPDSTAEAPTTAASASVGANEVAPTTSPGSSTSTSPASKISTNVLLLIVVAVASFALF